MQLKVAIVIINWNGWKDTLNCLKSVFEINYSGIFIIIVDNNSNDGSVNNILSYLQSEQTRYNFKYSTCNFSNLRTTKYNISEIQTQIIQNPKITNKVEYILIIQNDKNYGFACGNNIGIKSAIINFHPEFILLLNNDVIVQADFLLKLINAIRDCNDVGICSPKVLSLKNPKIIDSTGHIFKWGRIIDRGFGEVDNNQYDDNLNIVGGIAAACLYRVEMLNKIGFFNSKFGTMYEDAELSWRAYKNGWNAKYVPQAIVYHRRGGTINSNRHINRKMKFNYLKNVIKTVLMHGTVNQKIIFGLYLIGKTPIYWLSELKKHIDKS